MPTNEPDCVDNNHGKPEPLGGEGNPGDGKGNHGKAGTHGKGVIEEPERISPPGEALQAWQFPPLRGGPKASGFSGFGAMGIRPEVSGGICQTARQCMLHVRFSFPRWSESNRVRWNVWGSTPGGTIWVELFFWSAATYRRGSLGA